jgi:hypothetical protein
MSIFGFDTYYSILTIGWFLISLVAFIFMIRYFLKLGFGHKYLYRKKVKFNSSTILAMIMFFSLSQNIYDLINRDNIFTVVPIIGLSISIIFIFLQGINEFVVYEEGFVYNLNYVKWDEVLEYHIINKNRFDLIIIVVSKGFFTFKARNKQIVIKIKDSEKLDLIMKEYVIEQGCFES